MDWNQSLQGQRATLHWFTESHLQSVIRNGSIPEWFHGIVSRKWVKKIYMHLLPPASGEAVGGECGETLWLSQRFEMERLCPSTQSLFWILFYIVSGRPVDLTCMLAACVNGKENNSNAWYVRHFCFSVRLVLITHNFRKLSFIEALRMQFYKHGEWANAWITDFCTLCKLEQTGHMLSHSLKDRRSFTDTNIYSFVFCFAVAKGQLIICAGRPSCCWCPNLLVISS